MASTSEQVVQAGLPTTGVTRIQSYEIPVETPKAGKTKAEAAQVLGRLEQLEKAVAQDSVREVKPLIFLISAKILLDFLFQTLRRKRDMDPILEEQDFAFNNLVYTELASGETGLLYENVGEGHKYENVGEGLEGWTKYENVDDNRYENVTDTDQVKPSYRNVHNLSAENQKEKAPVVENQNVYENVASEDIQSDVNHCEHYENYDFGENGVYQNILFTTKSVSQPDTDVYSQLKTLKEAVSRVNDILMKESPDCADNISNSTKEEDPTSDGEAAHSIEKDEDCKVRKTPEESRVKGKVSAIREMFTFGKNRELATESAVEDSRKEKSDPISTVSRPTSMFRRWALARTEPPVMIDAERREQNKPASVFSSTEREIVAKFLENVKSELSTV